MYGLASGGGGAPIKSRIRWPGPALATIAKVASTYLREPDSGVCRPEWRKLDVDGGSQRLLLEWRNGLEKRLPRSWRSAEVTNIVFVLRALPVSY